MRDTIATYEDLQKQRALRQEERLSKGMKPEQLQTRLGAVLNLDLDVGMDTAVGADFGRLSSMALSNGDASSSMLSGSLSDPILSTLMLDAKSCSDRGQDVDEEMENEGTPKKAADANTPDNVKKEKWWDGDTAINRAERSYKKKLMKAHEKMCETLQEMGNLLSEFRKTPKEAELYFV